MHVRNFAITKDRLAKVLIFCTQIFYVSAHQAFHLSANTVWGVVLQVEPEVGALLRRCVAASPSRRPTPGPLIRTFKR